MPRLSEWDGLNNEMEHQMKKVLFAALGVLVMTGAAHAQMGGGAMFMQADANKDGKVTAAEMKAAREARFATLDVNKSGFIESGEMGQGAMMMGRMDADKDGKLSKAEFTDTTQMFGFMDKNKDGAIDQAEIDAMPRPGG